MAQDTGVGSAPGGESVREIPISELALGTWSKHGRGAEFWAELVALNPEELEDFSIPGHPEGFNFDESTVPPYDLPPVLRRSDGTAVATAEQWESRRAEILELYVDQMYGEAPDGPSDMRFTVLEQDPAALAGLACRKQVRIDFSSAADGPSMDLLLYTPANAAGPVGTFLGLNFGGNHTIHPDPEIHFATGWVMTGVGDSSRSRGQSESRWQLERVLKRGYGLATISYGDIDPDFDDGFKNGVHPLAPPQTPRDWGSIAAWSWGLSRALDYLESDSMVDATKVAVLGHSRLGKVALWAGATDTRFSIVIPINSGGGGAAITRHISGETLEIGNVRFPHWYAGNYKAYDGKESELPFDQHMLLALIAPRPLYVASAEDDGWADPHGEFLATMEAGPVYELLGKRGLGVAERPPVDEPVMNTVGYHVRTGRHNVTEYDWKRFLEFSDMHW